MTLESGLLVTVLTSIAGLAYWLGVKLTRIEVTMMPLLKLPERVEQQEDRVQALEWAAAQKCPFPVDGASER